MIQAWSDKELPIHHNWPSQTPSNEVVVVFKILFKGIDKKELNKPMGGFQFTHTWFTTHLDLTCRLCPVKKTHTHTHTHTHHVTSGTLHSFTTLYDTIRPDGPWCVFDRFRPSTLKWYASVFVLIYSVPKRVKIDPFLMKLLSFVLVWKDIKCCVLLLRGGICSFHNQI